MLMRKLIFAGMILAGSMFGAQAQDMSGLGPVAMPGVMPISGHLEIYGQKASMDNWDDYYNPWWGLGGAARVNWWLRPGTSAQFDFAGQVARESYSDYYWTGSLYGAAHISKRTDSYLIGLFGGVAATSDYEGYTGWDTSVFGGVEGQAYWGNFTLYAQAGFIKQFAGYYGGSSTYPSEYLFGLPFAQVEARYFVTPNTKISANVGITSGNMWGSYGGVTTVSYGAEIEHRFSTNPISVFARLQGFNTSGYYSNTGHRLMFGAKLNFGTDTLLAQDRNGATLKVMEDLAPIGDMRGWY